MRIAFAARWLAAAALAAAWAACAGAKEARMDEAVFGKTERVYAGRFSLEIPAGASRVGWQGEMADVSLEEVPLQEPLDEAFGRAWAAKLAAVEALKAERTRPHHIVGEVEAKQELEPRFWVVLYHADNVKSLVRYAALRQAGATGLWLSRPGPARYREAIQKAIVTVGRAYVPRAPGAPPAKGDVFHLPGGSVALPFHEQEAAKASFRGGPLDVEIELATRSTDKPKGGGLAERFGDAVSKAGAAFTAGMSVVRNRGRTAAGLGGEEFVMRAQEDGKLFFLWEFRGEASSGARPRIQLQMVTKDERQKEKMAYWDALVDSLRPAAAP